MLAMAGVASAENPAVSDIEVPAIVTEPDPTVATDNTLDVANLVRTAAKGITTVQEAPAIVTVVTADEIKDRQFYDLQQIIETVPGWTRVGQWNGMIPTALVRGQALALLFMRDGVSMADGYTRVPTFSRTQPLELVKRVEMITGPGGVLWGADSMVGIINVISKDAEDVEGIEVGGSYGDGVGDRSAGRVYAMAGASDILGTKLKLFAHGSVDQYQGVGMTLPLLLSHSTLPAPPAPTIFGPLTLTSQKRSLLVNLDGKLTYDRVQLRWQYPFGKMYRPAGLSGQPVRDRMDPNDPLGIASTNRSDQYDRFAVLEYRTRFGHDKAGITAHVYGAEFIRNFRPLVSIAPSRFAQGGVAAKLDFSSYRVGGAFDGDLELARSLRVLYGAEAIHEWTPDTHGQSRQGAGTGATVEAPPDLTRASLLCPRQYMDGMLVPLPKCPITSAFSASRSILGVYVNPQYRPNSKLIVNGGARVAVAPSALGSLSYDMTPTFSGTIVWNFIPEWHLKLNFSEGFRPPSFNSTQANAEALQIAGNPKLLVESSRAGQAEVNARIFKGERRIRELSFRFDGSYTSLTNLVQVENGKVANFAARGVLSGEFLGKLYLKGGHRIELGYTWLKGITADKGPQRNVPEHWFNLATVWSLWPKALSATTNIRVTGSVEDANRLVEYRGISYDAEGQPMGTASAIPTDLVLDRLPPMAELSAGIQYMPTSKISIQATVYNALLAHTYQPDIFGDYTPRLEYLPNPYEGFRAYLTASLQY
jgi:outer membrane receptor protein involved in Fe transport